jgi:YebC/PmpR family DNA-binding regulatory protein
MSGHSKWSTIKHKKAATDKKRSALFGKLAKIIQIAAKDGGDPALNSRLRQAIDIAKVQGLPADSITKAVKRGTGEDKNAAALEESIYEAKGPIGTAFIIEALTDNKNRTVADLRHLLSRAGGELSTAGSVAWQFTRKGVVTVALPADMDSFQLLAIDLGAADFEESEDELFVYTDPENLGKLTAGISKEGIEIRNSELVFEPQTTMMVNDEVKAKALLNLMDALDEHDDVSGVHPNFEIDPEVMAKLE